MKLHKVFRFFSLLQTALLLAIAPIASAQALKVVTTFSILGDMTKQVGGERVSVHTLVGPGGDAHVYQPTPSDAKTIAQSKLVVVNGLGFEGWIERLIKSSGYRAQVLEASKGVKTFSISRDTTTKNTATITMGKLIRMPGKT